MYLQDGGDVNKVKFIAGIPYFLTIPSLQKPEEENQEMEQEGETPNSWAHDHPTSTGQYK